MVGAMILYKPKSSQGKENIRRQVRDKEGGRGGTKEGRREEASGRGAASM
jgi:hypothetical protein